jgi:hypothetical protein
LKDPDDDNQWLFGHHLGRGGHGGLDLWLGFDQKLPYKPPNFLAKILHQAVQTTDRFPAHPYHHLLIDPDDDNQWLFGHHLARGGHGGLDLWLGFDQKLPQATHCNFLAKILHQAVQTTDRFPAHPYHHLLIDPDDDNQWLFGHHLARGGHGGLGLCLTGV